MKDYATILKSKYVNTTFINKILFIIILLIFSTSYFVYSMTNQEVALPENPINQFAENSSFVPLKGDFKHLLNSENQDDESDEQEDNEELEENEEENDSNEDENSDEQEEQDEREKNGEQGNEGEGEHENSESSNIEIINDPNGKNNEKVNKNEYFTTTIVDGEIVTKEQYSFRIKQKNHNYIVMDTEVFLNNKGVTDFQGTVSLSEGDNTITVKVTYQDKKGTLFSVSKSYTVILNTKDIIIYTNLENGKVVEEENITFKASAEYEGNEVPVTVKINGIELRESSEGLYDAKLKKDSNNIIISAKYKGKEAKNNITVFYKPKTSNVKIETDLKDQTVTKEEFTFYAVAKDGNKTVPLSTTLDNKSISDDGNGNYNVTLKEGKNTFVLTATSSGQTVEEQYIINYSMPDGGADDEDIESDIYIEFPDLKEGQTIRNSVHTFHVKAVDKKGKQINDRGITISAKNNGKNIPIDWNNGSHVSFTLSVVDGTNYIEVIAKDSKGNIGTASLTVYGDIASDDEVIGSITFSLEASTIGLGYIIPPQKVDLYPNERGAYTIDRIFKKYGISYDYTGSHSNSFYLSAIYKPGLVTNPKIPDDLAQLVERDFSVFDPNNYDSNALGEFDFSNGSGWMYSVNGHYPNVGFADYYFKDGDVVRIRFTIALGADIGGGMPGTNYGKEW